MQRSLLRGTGRLEASTRVEQRGSDDEFWGRDTESCMRRGAMRSLVALIDSSLAELARLGVGPGLVLTGGDAALIAQRLPSARSHPLLVLEGLAMIIADGLDPPGHAA
jgi:pantothenate kinase type III